MKRVVFAVAIFVIVLFCGVCMITPPSELYIYSNSDADIVKTLTADDIKSFNSCKLSSSGVIEITGDDAWIAFGKINPSFKSVKINTSEADNNVLVQVFIDDGDGYSVNHATTGNFLKGRDTVSVNIEGQKIKGLRIDIDHNYVLQSVELHSEPAEKDRYNVQTPWVNYIICLFVALFVMIVGIFIDKKFDISAKITEWIKTNIKKWLIHASVFVACIAVSGLIELIWSFLRNRDFTLYRFIFVCCVLWLIVLFHICRKEMAIKPEKFVLGALLILGIAFVVVRPVGHAAWDFESHFGWSLRSSYIGDVYITEADRSNISVDIYSLVSGSGGENFSKIEKMNESGKMLLSVEKSIFKVTHLPSGLFMAIARFLGCTYYQIVTFGRMANLILYAVLCYFAVKKLKSGKILVSILALIPTNIFLATSYSYDTWLTAFAFLGMAYFMSELQQPLKPVSTKDTVIMCVAFALACIPKAIYAPLLLIPFFMYKNDFKEKKKYYTICIAALALLFLFMAIKSLSIVSGPGDLRGGNVNPKAQILYILQHPVSYARTLKNCMKIYFAPGNAHQFLANFAYVGYGFGREWFLIFIAIAALTDKEENTVYKWPVKVVAPSVFIITNILIATSMYVAFTPVGNDTINGCQWRYMIPLLYPLLSVVGVKGIINKSNRTFYNSFLVLSCVFLNIYNIYYLFLSKVV